jgi:hypothetical protein
VAAVTHRLANSDRRQRRSVGIEGLFGMGDRVTTNQQEAWKGEDFPAGSKA